MGRHVVLSLFLIVSTVGCATLSGAPNTVKTSCAYDQAWSVALASVDEFELREVDQTGGVIATEWRGFASQRKAGALQRQVNEERARFFLNVEVARPIRISVQQVREFYSPVGARSQSTWRRIPPVAEEERRLIRRITNQLLDKGCTVIG